MTDYADLVKRLRETMTYSDKTDERINCNPDGPEAADAIETLVRERDEAIRPKDNWCNVAQDFCRERDEARAELERVMRDLVTVPLLQRAEAAEAEVARLREALVEYNDALRSAFQIASREGKDVNWTGFANTVQNTLSAHHETVNIARAALEGK